MENGDRVPSPVCLRGFYIYSLVKLLFRQLLKARRNLLGSWCFQKLTNEPHQFLLAKKAL
jgi:hypothetical protein